MNLVTRRQTLKLIAQIAAGLSLTACGVDSNDEASLASESAQGNTDVEILASIAYELFPFQALSPVLYVNVAERVLGLGDPIVTEGLEVIRSIAGEQSWLSLQDEQRVEILSSIDESRFFTLMRATSIAVLYQDQETLDLVGYGGSAIEKGGYLNRGFNDITWLP